MARHSSLLPLWKCALLLRLIPFAATNEAAVEALSASAPSPTRKTLRVCQSPGCRDDGAASTFECLSAVAPPGLDVVKGGCVSLCGAGPVVELCDDVDSRAFAKKKRVKGRDVILSLLDECVAEDGEPALRPRMRDRLMSGYETSLEAHEAYAKRDYRSAVDLYAKAVESGREPATILQEARVASGGAAENDGERSIGYPEGLRWLVLSFTNSARSRLSLKDVDGARRDALAATALSRSRDADAHECLAEACAASGDASGELEATKAAIAEHARTEEECSRPLPGADAPRRAEAVRRRGRAAARRRELGFRVARLEAELGTS